MLVLYSFKVSSVFVDFVLVFFFFQCVETLRCWRTTVSLTPFKSKKVSVIHSSSSQPTSFLQSVRTLPFLNSRLCPVLLILL